MRGFYEIREKIARRGVEAALFVLVTGVALFNGGCSGVVNGQSSKTGGGTPTPLTISGVAATNPTVTSVVINWQTSAPASSQVQYGTSTSYGSATALDPSMVTTHQQTISNLKPATLYHFRVNSTDANSNSAVSGDMTFTTSSDVTPPLVSITSPVANATLSGTVNLTANATDNVAVAGVQYQVDGASTGPVIAAAPYNYSLNTTVLSNGNHILTAVGSDTSGNTATSAGVPVTVNNSSKTPDTTPPVVTITTPTNNASVSATITLSATATDPDSAVSFVQFLVDGTNTGAQLTSSPYTLSLDTTKLTNSSHTLKATAKDPAGNLGTSVAVSIIVNNAPPAPSITSLNPASGVVGTSVKISGAKFGTTQGASTLKFNGKTAVPTSWSATSIIAPVPVGATTGNVVVTVGGVASNGVSFTVQLDTTPPVVTITAPANNANVSGTITLTATATDPDSAVSFVQFQVDGTNTGGRLTSAPYSLSLNTITLTNAAHTLTAVAQDPAGNQGTSATVTITVSNTTGAGATGPLRPLASNPHYFTDGSGKAILLTGSQTWDSFQDLDQSSSPAPVDFTAYVNFLKSHGHNVTILWRKDLPTYCGWGAGGTWHIKQFPWKRTGGSSGNQVASDGLPAFDLTQLDQAYFDRLRARVIQLQQNGIYAIVELFDGLGLSSNRCSNDGYPFTGGNNVNGVDDGGGTNSMTMTSPNTITGYQDTFVQKVIDTVNDQPNVLWEISEEAPDNSTWWQGHMIALFHTYEAGKPNQHPVGFPTLNVSGASDSTLYNSNADWVAPMVRISPTSSCGSGTPPCKVNINDSDHSYFGMWNDSAQANRNYVWENFANGNSVMFMDPYVIHWTTGNRNLCQSPSNGVCTGPDSRWNNMRDNLGYTLNYAIKMDLAKMTPQGSLSSTGHCLAQTPSVGAEYLVYAPNGGSFTVNLSATTRVLNVEWFDPSSGTTTSGGTLTGGSTKSFTPPFGGDAVLYLVDAAGHN